MWAPGCYALTRNFPSAAADCFLDLGSLFLAKALCLHLLVSPLEPPQTRHAEKSADEKSRQDNASRPHSNAMLPLKHGMDG
jgi:hypothetical protein